LIALALFALLAVAAALVLEQRDGNDRLSPWLLAYLRIALAATLFGFGMIKLLPRQFPFPSLERLTVPFGESSPRGLLWTFMGYSRVYGAVAGAAEILAGALLVWPRTSVIGALLSLALTANVALLDLCFDVQVKLLVIHLVMASLLFALPALVQIGRSAFAGDRDHPGTAQAPAVPLRAQPRLHLLRIAFVAGALAFDAREALRFLDQRGAHRARPMLYGIHQVERVERDGAEIPPLATDASRPSLVIVDIGQGPAIAVSVRSMTGSVARYRGGEGTASSAITVLRAGGRPPRVPRGPARRHRGAPAGEDRVLLRGEFDGRPIRLHLHRSDELQLPLLRQSFRWLTE